MPSDGFCCPPFLLWPSSYATRCCWWRRSRPSILQEAEGLTESWEEAQGRKTRWWPQPGPGAGEGQEESVKEGPTRSSGAKVHLEVRERHTPLTSPGISWNPLRSSISGVIRGETGLDQGFAKDVWGTVQGIRAQGEGSVWSHRAEHRSPLPSSPGRAQVLARVDTRKTCTDWLNRHMDSCSLPGTVGTSVSVGPSPLEELGLRGAVEVWGAPHASAPWAPALHTTVHTTAPREGSQDKSWGSWIGDLGGALIPPP